MDNDVKVLGIGLSSLLTIVFLVLKLVGVINWSWWLVFLPIIIDAGLVILIVTVYVIYIIHESKKYEIKPKKDKKDKWKF